jgi:hypothetical protein
MASYKITTQATVEPLTLAEVKLHLRVDHDDEDSMIGLYMKAARQHAERFLGLSLAAQSVQYVLANNETPRDEWRMYEPRQPNIIELPLSPVASIESVTDGVDPYDHTANLLIFPATIRCESIPEVLVIDYTTEPLVEEDIRLALLLIIHTMYETRGAPEPDTLDRISEAYLRAHRVNKGMA